MQAQAVEVFERFTPDDLADAINKWMEPTINILHVQYVVLPPADGEDWCYSALIVWEYEAE